MGSIPSRKELKNDPYYQNVRMWKATFKILPYGREAGYWMGDTSTPWWSIWPEEVENILTGQKSVEQGLKDMEERTDKIIQKYYEKG